MRLIRNILLLSLGFWTVLAQAQILDDSTKQIYGPHTTRYFYEADLGEDSISYQHINHELSDYYDFGNLNEGRLYQDLGTIGSASRRLFDFMPSGTGVQLGLNSFNRYAFTPEDTRYFNTRSPYAEVNYCNTVGQNEFIHGLFSQNINPNANIGFEIRRFTSLDQVGANPNRNDFFTDHFGIRVFGSYFSPNGRYKALGHFRYLRETQFDNGGAILDDDDSSDVNNIIFEDLRDPNLDDVRTRERRNAWHVYQQYALSNKGGVVLYHSFDRLRQKNTYEDYDVDGTKATGLSNLQFYDNIAFLNIDTTFDSLTYTQYINRVGIRTNYGGGQVTAYYKDRLLYLNGYNVGRNGKQEFYHRKRHEAYVGLNYRQRLGKSVAKVGGEFSINKRYHSLFGELSSKRLKAQVQGKILPASFVNIHYRGNHFTWGEQVVTGLEFDDQIFVNGSFKYRFGRDSLNIEPFAQWDLVHDYIYYNQDALPDQLDGWAQVFGAGFTARVWLRKNIFASQLLRFTTSSEDEILPVPLVYSRTRVFWETDQLLKGGKLLTQLGFDLFWHSNYKAMAYMPETQQFYQQSDFEVDQLARLDLFIRFRLKTVMLYVKGYDVTRLFVNGYQSTPTYPGTKPAFGLGAVWRFYN